MPARGTKKAQQNQAGTIYTEGFHGRDHLRWLQDEAHTIASGSLYATDAPRLARARKGVTHEQSCTR